MVQLTFCKNTRYDQSQGNSVVREPDIAEQAFQVVVCTGSQVLVGSSSYLKRGAYSRLTRRHRPLTLLPCRRSLHHTSHVLEGEDRSDFVRIDASTALSIRRCLKRLFQMPIPQPDRFRLHLRNVLVPRPCGCEMKCHRLRTVPKKDRVASASGPR